VHLWIISSLTFIVTSHNTVQDVGIITIYVSLSKNPSTEFCWRNTCGLRL
jgi:uncharacterized protein YdaL